MWIDAAVARAGAPGFSIEPVQIPSPAADEVLVRVVAAGICHTDLVAQSGAILKLPAVLGHEGSGVVEAIGASVTRVRPGDRVTLSFRSCGQCPNCQKALPSYCRYFTALNYAGTRLDGSHTHLCDGKPLSSFFFGQSSFATHALTFERNLVKLPDTISHELAAPLGCGVQTGAGAIMRSFNCQPDDTLLVMGAGAVGLSAVMAAAIRGCQTVAVVEPNARRRELALALGAHVAIDPAAQADIDAALRGVLPRGVKYALDTTGKAQCHQVALSALEPHGTLGLLGVGEQGQSVPGEVNAMITYGITVKGILEGDCDPASFIPELIEYYLNGQLPIDQLIRCYPFASINQAIKDQHRGECVKAVLLMGSD